MRAIMYNRISSDPANDRLGVERHAKACRAKAAQHGWTVLEEIVDNDVSAYKGLRREGYARLIKMVRAGEVDVIITQATSRIWRNRRERAEGIEIFQHARVSIVPINGAPLEFASAQGRFIAGVMGEADTWESDIKSERTLGKAVELAEAGKIGNGGNRPFGYHRTYEGTGPRRKIVADTLDPIEAPIVAEMAARSLAGESLHTLTLDLNRRGIKTSTGRAWTHQALRCMLSSARIAGFREHHGVIVAKAVWPAIISREDHDLLRIRHAFPGTNKGRPARVHPIGGLVYCGKCEAAGRTVKMHGQNVCRPNGINEARFGCASKSEGGCGGCAIRLDHLNGWIDILVYEELARRGSIPGEADPSSAAAGRVAASKIRLAALEAALVDGDPETIPSLTAAIREVRRRIEVDRVEVLAPVVDVEDLIKRWDRIVDFEEKSTALRQLIEKVVVMPAQRTGIKKGGWDTERIKVSWK